MTTFKEFGTVIEEKPKFKEYGRIVEEPSDIKSRISAFPKGLIKGTQELVSISDPVGFLLGTTQSSPLQEKVIENLLPTKKEPISKGLERAGKLIPMIAGSGEGLVAKGARVAGGAALGQLAEEAGAPEWAQNLVETGVLLAPKNLKGAQKYISGLYDKAENLAKDATVSAKNLGQHTRRFLSELKKGGPAVSKNPATTQAEAILKKIKNNKIDVKELTEFKKTINEARSGLFAEKLDRKGQRLAKKNLDEVSKIVDNALSEYGAKNPEWEKLYRNANEGFGAIQKSRKVSNWIEKMIKTHPTATGIGLATSLIGHAISPKTIPIALTGYGAVKSGEFISRISKSKVLRKYYSDLIKSAVQEKPASFFNALKNLDKEFKSTYPRLHPSEEQEK